MKFIQHGDFWVNFENYVKNIEFYSKTQRNDKNKESYWFYWRFLKLSKLIIPLGIEYFCLKTQKVIKTEENSIKCKFYRTFTFNTYSVWINFIR